MIDYSILGVDQEGNMKFDLSLPRATIAEIILTMLETGKLSVTSGAEIRGEPIVLSPENIERVVRQTKKALHKKTGTKGKSAATEKKGGKTRQRVMDVYNEGMRDPDAIAKKLGMTGPAVRYHLNAEGVDFEGKKRTGKSPDTHTAKSSLPDTHPGDDEEDGKEKTKRVKELLIKGVHVNDISDETGISIRTIDFMRRQMVSRGEIEE